MSFIGFLAACVAVVALLYLIVRTGCDDRRVSEFDHHAHRIMHAARKAGDMALLNLMWRTILFQPVRER